MIQQIVECEEEEEDFEEEEEADGELTPEHITNGTAQASGGDQKMGAGREKSEEQEKGDFSWQVVVVKEEGICFMDPHQ